MNRIITFMAMTAAMAATLSASQPKENDAVSLTIVETTDVHGNYLPYNFIERQAGSGSLARVATYIDSLRKAEGDEAVILLDCGDLLQGQPSAYYYNFIDTVTPHLASRIYDAMRYDAATIGNHDVETGHAVYDRWRRQTAVPVMGANVISTPTGLPYLPPYTILNRKGVKIAVLGLLTPAIPAWLPENLWAGLNFEDMVTAASHWVNKIRREEKPDLMIGLFHSGRDSSKTTDSMMENASLYIAENVPGFDIIFFGHDHQQFNEKVTAKGASTQTAVLNPANNAQRVATARVTLDKTANGYKVSEIDGALEDVTHLEPSPEFMSQFGGDMAKIDKFVSRTIGEATDTMSTRDAYFGPSTFMQLVHDLQLEISGADISFAAPLSYDASINRGPLHVSDMFTLYKYENMLYTMALTGREVKDYLEMAYDLWTNQVDATDANSQLLKFASATPSLTDNRLKNPSYNFDSAAGIRYTVDVTKPRGSKIDIISMADGTAFDPDATYKVAINSYRGNGGGDLLTKGAGIPREELKGRIISSTDKDLRYYLMKEVEKRGVIEPKLDVNWQFIPAGVANEAAGRSRALLFGVGASKDQK